jgi:hypothetical protein
MDLIRFETSQLTAAANMTYRAQKEVLRYETAEKIELIRKARWAKQVELRKQALIASGKNPADYDCDYGLVN